MADNIVSKMVALFQFRNDGANRQQLGQAEKGLQAVTRAAGALGVALGTGALIQGTTNFFNNLRNTNVQLANTSTALGISTADLQRWNFAGEQVGLQAGAMGQALQILQEKATDAFFGGAGSAQVFSDLGVEIRDSNGQLKDASALMLDVAQGAASMADRTRRVGQVSKLLGGSLGTQLLPLFEKGAGDIQRMRRELDTLGGVSTPAMIKAAKEEQVALAKLGAAFRGLRDAILEGLGFEGSADFIDKVTGFIQTMRDIADQTYIVDAVKKVMTGLFMALTFQGITGAGGAIARASGFMLAFAGLVAATDQVLSYRAGTNKNLERFFAAFDNDGLAGAFGSMDKLTTLEKIIVSLGAALEKIVQGYEALYQLSQTGFDFSAVFGIDTLKRQVASVQAAAAQPATLIDVTINGETFTTTSEVAARAAQALAGALGGAVSVVTRKAADTQ